MNYLSIFYDCEVVKIYDDANQLIGYHWAFENAFANVIINEDNTYTIDDWQLGCIADEEFNHIVWASICVKTYNK